MNNIYSQKVIRNFKDFIAESVNVQSINDYKQIITKLQNHYQNDGLYTIENVANNIVYLELKSSDNRFGGVDKVICKISLRVKEKGHVGIFSFEKGDSDEYVEYGSHKDMPDGKYTLSLREVFDEIDKLIK